MDCKQRMSSFNISSSLNNNKPGISLRPPLFIGDFSLDGNRKFHADKRNLKLIEVDFEKSKNVSFDLNTGMEKVKRKNMNETKNEKLDRIFDWLLLNKDKFHTEQSKRDGLKTLSTDFVCFRGLLTEILCTPYEKREGWITYATKYAGTIYLLSEETPEKKQQRLNETEMNRKMSSWGFKFEQYMTNEDPKEGVDENEEYCCILRSRLQSHSIVYGAEVDGANTKLYHSPHSNLNAFIELKTCKELTSQRDFHNFYRFRLRKWWAQSHLVGVPHLICGLRDLDGVVHTLKSFAVEELPSMAKSHWKHDVMLNFLNDFLSWLKKVVAEDNPYFVYKLNKSPGSDQITCTSVGTHPKDCFIPSNFIKEIFKN